MSNYQAIWTTLQNLRKHPLRDRLQIADAAGYEVIVSTKMKEGDKGMVIPAGSQLSMNFCLDHNLLRKHPDTGEALGGYLDPSRRVRPMVLGGVESQALFISIPLDGLEEGQEFESIPGYDNFVCKYETPAQIKEKKIKEQSTSLPKKKEKVIIPKHYDTKPLRRVLRKLQEESAGFGKETVITEKAHGTSGRTACLLSKLKRVWNSFMPKSFHFSPKIITGTRNTLIGDKNTGMRKDIHDYFSTKLRPGEMVFYEIVGYKDNGGPIVGNHSLKKIKDEIQKKQLKELISKYGETIVYKYGCKCNGATFPELIQHQQNLIPRYRVFVYRITQDGRELTYSQMEERMKDLSWNSYVNLIPLLHHDSKVDLLEVSNILSRGSSHIDPSHLIEGVCVRVDGKVGGKAYKHKGFLFSLLEGVAADDPGFFDEEDVG